jgi:hypothetical protein
LIFTVHPEDEDCVVEVVKIETEYLHKLVIDAVIQSEVAQQVAFFSTTSRHPHFKSASGYIFEKFVLAWLFCAHTPGANNLPCTAADPTTGPLQLTPIPWAKVILFSGSSTLAEVHKHPTPFGFLPVSQVFPSIDAIICTDEDIITIQSTVSSTHSANLQGFDEVKKCLPVTFTKEHRWCHVFITHNDNNAQVLRRPQFEELRKRQVSIYSAVLNVGIFGVNNKAMVCGHRP